MNLLDKLKNFAESAHTWILAGMPVVDQPTYDRRLYICSNCPDLIDGSCRHCGCAMKVKAWLATEPCARPGKPLWPAEVEE